MKLSEKKCELSNIKIKKLQLQIELKGLKIKKKQTLFEIRKINQCEIDDEYENEINAEYESESDDDEYESESIHKILLFEKQIEYEKIKQELIKTQIECEKSKQELKAGFQRINQALMQLKMLSKNLSGATSSKLATKETDKSR